MRNRILAILAVLNGQKVIVSIGPVCPNCCLDTFDDWWHDPTMKRGVGMIEFEGRLRCHGCGRFFSVAADLNGHVRSAAKVSVQGEAMQEANTCAPLEPIEKEGHQALQPADDQNERCNS